MERQDRSALYIDGGWRPPDGSQTIEVVDPATEEVIASIRAGSPADVDAAVAAARRAFPGWAATSPEERAKYLSALHEALTARQEEVARTISA